jgi:hypothetical protein
VKEEPFWVVWNPNRGNPQFRHPSFDEAMNEAKRLCGAQPGEEFIVLRAVCAVRTHQPFEITHFDELPF